MNIPTIADEVQVTYQLYFKNVMPLILTYKLDLQFSSIRRLMTQKCDLCLDYHFHSEVNDTIQRNTVVDYSNVTQ